MGKRRKKIDPKPCAECDTEVNKLTRIQADESGAWLMVCDDCWSGLAEDNPNYTYGGVWRAFKRRS